MSDFVAIHWRLTVRNIATDLWYERLLCTSTKREQSEDGSIVYRPTIRDTDEGRFRECATCGRIGRALLRVC